MEGFFTGSAILSPTDIIFGVLVGIVLLNVVIAIVNSVWDTTSSDVARMFWEFRLYFLADTDTLVDFLHCAIHPLRATWLGSTIWGTVDWIDDRPTPRFRDQVNWDSKPYSAVTSFEQYLAPSMYFMASDVKQMYGMRSLQADLKWFAQTKRLSRVGRIRVTLNWLWSCVEYFLLLLLGLPTFGYTWPREFRRLCFENNYHHDETASTATEQMNRIQDALHHVTELLADRSEDAHTLGVVESDEKLALSTKTLSMLEMKLDDLLRSCPCKRRRSSMSRESSNGILPLQSR